MIMVALEPEVDQLISELHHLGDEPGYATVVRNGKPTLSLWSGGCWRARRNQKQINYCTSHTSDGGCAPWNQ